MERERGIERGIERERVNNEPTVVFPLPDDNTLIMVISLHVAVRVVCDRKDVGG